MKLRTYNRIRNFKKGKKLLFHVFENLSSIPLQMQRSGEKERVILVICVLKLVPKGNYVFPLFSLEQDETPLTSRLACFLG